MYLILSYHGNSTYLGILLVMQDARIKPYSFKLEFWYYEVILNKYIM